MTSNSDDEIREDLAEVLERRRMLTDEARPEAVAKRHDRGGRTARENLDDLIDEGSFVEYGGLAVAAQRSRRELDELIARTPADGLIAGTARINGEPCAVISYDYMVLAGTQGALGHRKKDRIFELIERMRLPTVIFTEGGGGRPGDTDHMVVSALDTRAFALWARLSGLVPRIAIVSGRCFAGNAVLAGASDLIVATQNSALGMGGPAMIAGGGLGQFEPEEVGPISVQGPNGVVDVEVADEAEAVAVSKRLLSYFQGPLGDWEAPDPLALRDAIPERSRRAYDVGRVIEGARRRRLDDDAPRRLRARDVHGADPDRGTPGRRDRQQLDARGRRDHERRLRQGGAVHAALRRVRHPARVADRHAGDHGRARRRSRRLSSATRLALFVAGANLRVPLVAVILRRAFGLGAQAMAGGGLHEPLLTVGWPTAQLGAMGLEGAVRLGFRHEYESIEDEAEREAKIEELVAMAYEHAKALNAATLFELDDVIDPADTRRVIASTLAAAGADGAEPPPRPPSVDTW